MVVVLGISTLATTPALADQPLMIGGVRLGVPTGLAVNIGGIVPVHPRRMGGTVHGPMGNAELGLMGARLDLGYGCLETGFKSEPGWGWRFGVSSMRTWWSPLLAPPDANLLGARLGVSWKVFQGSVGVYRDDWGRDGPVRVGLDFGLGWGG